MYIYLLSNREELGEALGKASSSTSSERLGALDWNLHEQNIYRKVVHWFEVIGKILQDPAVLVENGHRLWSLTISTSKVTVE